MSNMFFFCISENRYNWQISKTKIQIKRFLYPKSKERKKENWEDICWDTTNRKKNGGTQTVRGEVLNCSRNCWNLGNRIKCNWVIKGKVCFLEKKRRKLTRTKLVCKKQWYIINNIEWQTMLVLMLKIQNNSFK